MKRIVQFFVGSLVIGVGAGLYYFQFIDKHDIPVQQMSANSEVTPVDHSLELPPAKIGESFATVNQVRIASNDIKNFKDSDYKSNLSDIEEEINLKRLNQNNRVPASEEKKDK